MTINKILLQQMIDDKYITVRKHPDTYLFIYNYTAKTQYEQNWNEVTSICRGLILDSNYNVVARPFPKFFNLEEHESKDIPALPFDVFSKEDGSLGILFHANNKPQIATRGSFESDQAIFATKLLHDKYSHVFPLLDKTKTYLFEIIYPENRIVVDYGDTEDLILLTVIDTQTGVESLPDIGFPLVKKYDGIKDLYKLKELEENNKEGFVIKFQNNFRVKVKFAEYVRLHRILTCISNVSIWECLSKGDSLDEFLDRVPDEFYDWVKKTHSEIITKYNEIENECKSVFKKFDDRKEAAQYFMKQKYPSILFCMLDGKDYSNIIYKMIRPVYSKPFMKEEE